MATQRKRLQVLLTPEQYEVLRTLAGHSMSQFAAEILIEACKLPGHAPSRGTYTRAIYQTNEDGTHSPDYQVMPMSNVEQVVYGAQLANQQKEDDSVMPSGALERLRA